MTDLELEESGMKASWPLCVINVVLMLSEHISVGYQVGIIHTAMLVSFNGCNHIKTFLSNLQYSMMQAGGSLQLMHRSGLRVGLVSVLLIICCSARPWDQQQLQGRKGELGHGSSSSTAYTAPAVKPQDPNPWLVNVDPYIPNWNDSTDVNSEPPAGAAPAVFNVLLYDAAGDGDTDDTDAFQATWNAACQVKSAVILVPADHVFVVGQITFKGPCSSSLIFQVDGLIVPLSNLFAWAALPNKVQWIGFYKQVDMTLRGSGIIDGNGDVWWRQACKLFSHGTRRCSSPTAVKFYGCVNVIVRDITIQNSPQMHLKFDNCQQIQVANMTIFSPAWSPNTDGVHLQNTGYALLENLVIGAGDDCISLQTGTTDVMIRNVVCGPGHGISIGGLGQGKSQACVTNVTVQDVLLQDTENGVRIKTWQGGTGAVQHVEFSNITLSNVRNPIVINQFYCDAVRCGNESAAVLVSDISFRDIQGTYDPERSRAAIYFACSDTVPCRNILVENVELVATRDEDLYPPVAYCVNSYGVADPFSCNPPICLIDSPYIIERSLEYC